jgi:5'-3' exonuclease
MNLFRDEPKPVKEKLQQPRFQHLIVDANNLFYRVAIDKSPDVEKLYEDVVCNPVMGFFDRLKSIQEQFAYDNSTVYLLFDNPGSVFYKRREIDTSYKHRREQTRLNSLFLNIINLIQQVALSYSDSYRVVRVDGYEADDLVKPLMATFNLSYYANCLLISNDLDWSRGITDYSYWYNHKKLYDRSYFIKKYGFDPSEEKVILWKSLTGDNSDCIEPGLKNATKEIIDHILKTYRNVDDLIRLLPDDIELTRHWKDKILESADRLRLNHQLVSFVPFDGNILGHVRTGKKDEAMMNLWFSVIEKEDFVKDFDAADEDDFFGNAIKI